MKGYKFHKVALTLIVFVMVAVAPYMRFYNHNFFNYWPYFNWELGFGSVPFRSKWELIFIEEIDGKALNPPVRLSEYLLHHAPGKTWWIPTQHYKIQTMLTQAYYRKDKEDLERVKNLIIKYWWMPIAKESVRYHLAIVEIDPIHYKQSKKFNSKFIIFRDHYVK